MQKFGQFFEYENLAKICQQLNLNLLILIKPILIVENLAKYEKNEKLKIKIAKMFANLRKMFGKIIEQKLPNEWRS